MYAGTSKEAQITNSNLSDIRSKIRDVYAALIKTVPVVTAEMIRDAYLENEKPSLTLWPGTTKCSSNR